MNKRKRKMRQQLADYKQLRLDFKTLKNYYFEELEYIDKLRKNIRELEDSVNAEIAENTALRSVLMAR